MTLEEINKLNDMLTSSDEEMQNLGLVMAGEFGCTNLVGDRAKVWLLHQAWSLGIEHARELLKQQNKRK